MCKKFSVEIIECYKFSHILRGVALESVCKCMLAPYVVIKTRGHDLVLVAMHVLWLLWLQREIGWRDTARKMLLFSTDAGFHFAGDGKVMYGIKESLNNGRTQAVTFILDTLDCLGSYANKIICFGCHSIYQI